MAIWDSTSQLGIFRPYSIRERCDGERLLGSPRAGKETPWRSSSICTHALTGCRTGDPSVSATPPPRSCSRNVYRCGIIPRMTERREGVG